MGLFSKSTNGAAAPTGTELPITTTATASGTGAAVTSGSTVAVAIPPSSDAATAPPAKQSKWHRGPSSSSDPNAAASTSTPTTTTAPAKSSLAATASGDAHAAEMIDAAFEKKYAHLTPAERRKIKELDALASTLDSKFGIGPIKIGYDSIIGMVPFAGDAFGAAMGTYVIGNAIKLGMPRRLVGRMMINVGLDTVFGMIPFVGDIFDIAHKSNSKNIALLKGHLEHPRKATAADTCFLCGIFFIVVVLPCLIFLAVIAGIILLILWLCRLIFQ